MYYNDRVGKTIDSLCLKVINISLCKFTYITNWHILLNYDYNLYTRTTIGFINAKKIICAFTSRSTHTKYGLTTKYLNLNIYFKIKTISLAHKNK